MLYLIPLILAGVVSAAGDSGLGCYSSIDTSVPKGYDSFQTSSLCAGSCGSSYPYVAVQNGGYCFCLSSLPTQETSSSNCQVKCNGYGQVMCGGTSAYTVFEGLGFEAGDNTASPAGSSASLLGTLATSSLPASSTSPSSKTTSTASDNSRDSSSITQSPSADMLGSTTVILSTSSGDGSASVRTVTQTFEASATSTSEHSGSKKLTNVGPIVGGVVGGLAALALIGVGIFFFLRHRNSDAEDDEEEIYEKGAGGGAGGLSRGNGTNKSKNLKYNSAFDMPMANPFVHPLDEFADKRMSRMTQSGVMDPRLNPAMVGRRRLSEGLLADESDYSRKILAVANP